jgi:hypothetical protein
MPPIVVPTILMAEIEKELDRAGHGRVKAWPINAVIERRHIGCRLRLARRNGCAGHQGRSRNTENEISHVNSPVRESSSIRGMDRAVHRSDFVSNCFFQLALGTA